MRVSVHPVLFCSYPFPCDLPPFDRRPLSGHLSSKRFPFAIPTFCGAGAHGGIQEMGLLAADWHPSGLPVTCRTRIASIAAYANFTNARCPLPAARQHAGLPVTCLSPIPANAAKLNSVRLSTVDPYFAQPRLTRILVRCLIRAANVVSLSRLAGPRLTPFSIRRRSPNKRTRFFALVTAV